MMQARNLGQQEIQRWGFGMLRHYFSFGYYLAG
jgi:hypothetical protein